MKKIAVIGAGISGLSIAQLLKEEFHVEVYESANRAGGLVSCDIVDEILFHKVGGHVFNSKNQLVLDWFWSFFDKENEFVKAKRNAKILLDNKLIGYPIENYLFELNKNVAESIIYELKNMPSARFQNPFLYESFEEFLKDNFGLGLYELYFKPYNEKIWKTDLSQVPMAWLEGKLPMPNVSEILKAFENPKEESDMVHSTFYYPKNGGSQFIADRLSQNLTIHYNVKVANINRSGEQWNLDGNMFDYIVYTGNSRDMSILFKEEIPIDLTSTLTQLRSNGTSNYLCKCDATDLSWLYLPEKNTKAHRIIFTGNFSVNNNPYDKGRSTCVVEFSGKCSPEEMKNEIAELPFNLQPVQFNYARDSYVIQDSDTRKVIGDAKNILKSKNVFLLGRFAEWEYYNMDKAIEAAMSLKSLISDEK
ncbi:MAG: NAD(P)-binding protein [Cytophagaceae bacterium]